MNVILVPVGSHGDVHPFVGLGIALRGRGHRVTVVSSAYFEPLVRRVGLDMVPLGTSELYREIAADPDLWHPTRGFKAIFRRAVHPFIRPTFEAIERLHVPGETVVVGSSLAFGARVAQEVMGVPT